MGNTFYFEWEPVLMAWIQSFLGDIGVAACTFFTFFGQETLMILVLGFFYFYYDKEIARKLGLNVMICNLAAPMIKNVFNRRRPYFDNPSVKCLKPVEPQYDVMDIKAQGFSFPSGHSTNAATLYGSIISFVKKTWVRVACVAIILLVGMSRVALGCHYPTDVLCGWTLGVCIVILMNIIVEKVSNRYLIYLVTILVASMGIFYCRTNDYFTGLGSLIGFCLGDMFEQKFVNFEVTKKIPVFILRFIGFVAVYLVFNTLLKLPFSTEFLQSGTMAAYMVRAIRYAIVLFLMIGIYPISFKIGKKNR